MTGDPELVVLGVTQDGGFPQAGCVRPCCAPAWTSGARARVACLGVRDGDHRFLVDCTPDLPSQLRDVGGPPLHGILLTHAHSGHYTGLLHLGPEAWCPQQVPVFAMPGMTAFLRDNAPWCALETDGQVKLLPLVDGEPVPLGPRTTATPRRVSHRGPWSETVAFELAGPSRRALYLPDIDRWDDEVDPAEWIARVDRAYLDATFFSPGEIPWRGQVAHPFVEDTIARLRGLPARERAKVAFVHLNHTNPLLDPRSEEWARVAEAGMTVAQDGERFSL
ncbi:MAG: MBL fold metallo-hydrolase [Myxococcota bacterium]